jgi:internalin A
VNGDYHLASQAGRWEPEKKTWVTDDATSVCIDTGDPTSPAGDEPSSNGSVLNMGAYGGTAQASKFYLEDIQWHQPVTFTDGHLKELVEAALWVWDPTPADLLGLTSFSATLKGISDLTGLQYATNLQSLELAVNEITDISPLARLTNLQSLVLNNNHIRNLSPIVRLTQLEYLDIHENQIADVSPLSRLERLKRVIIYQNQITDIAAVSELPRLLSLDLLDNQVTNISPLTSLTTLQELDLRNNPLEQEAYDLYLPQIEANNPGIELKHDPLVPCRLTVLSSAGGSAIQPGEGIFTYEQGEIVRLEAQADPGYVFTGWSGTYSSTSNPAYITMNQNNSVWASFAESHSGP